MKLKIALSIFLGMLISPSLYLPLPIAAQLAPPKGSGREMASVTFTFSSACEDCATQSGEAGDNRYFIDVPISNNPSPAKSGVLEEVNMEVTVRNDRLVYAILFKPGTSPRAVWRNGGRILQVFFVPPDGSISTNAVIPTDAARTETAFAANPPPPPVAITERAAQGSPVAAPADLASATTTAAAASPVDPAAGPETTTIPLDRDVKGSNSVAAVDMSVPESPAFTVLGLTPETVTRPTSPRQFATSLLNGVDTSGNFQSGLALDFVPYLLLAGDQSTLRDYQTRYVTRLFSRSQFSFATTKGASDDDKSMRLALGLNLTLWDRGDPRTDEELMTCLSTMKLPRPPTQLEPELLEEPPSSADPREFAEQQKRYNEAVKRFGERLKLYTADNARFESEKLEAIEFNNGVSSRCRDESRKRNWNRSSWTIAAAPSWISTTGQTKNFIWNGGGFWTSLAYGFEGIPGLKDRSQLILHGRYRNNEQVPDPDSAGNFFSQNSAFFGSRFRHGSPTFNGSFEYTFLRTRLAGKASDNSARLSLGFERRIAGDTWFTLSLGGETGRADGKNNGFVLSSFKWAFSERKDVPTPNQ
jgi:hypothetical protein